MSVNIILLENQTANVAAGAAKQNDAATTAQWSGGERLVCVDGTFGGATVKLEFLPGAPLTSYIANAELTWTSSDITVVWLPGRGTVSASVSSASGSTDVTMTIQDPRGNP